MHQNEQNPLKPLLNSLGSALNPSSGKSQNGKASKNSSKQKKRSKSANRNANAGFQTSLTMAPAAIGTVVSQGGRGQNKPYCIPRREYLVDVIGSTTLNITTYSINPGLALFPWLAGQARSYDLYRFTRFRFIYLTRDNTTDKGRVVCGFDPNPQDPNPTTMQRLENYGTRLVVSPWENGLVDVPQKDLNRHPQFLVRDAIVGVNLDTYDIGTFSVGVVGTTNSTDVIGEIWVDYECHFLNPQPIDDLTSLPQASEISAFTQPNVSLTTATPLVLQWNGSTLANGLRLNFGGPSGTGIITGVRAALRVSATLTAVFSVAPSPSSTILAFETSSDGGTTWTAIRQFYYVGTAGTETGTLDGLVLLQPNLQFRTTFVSTFTGTGSTASGVRNQILITAV